MIPNCELEIESPVLNFEKNINVDKRLKRKSASDSNLSYKRARLSVPVGFPHQWGLFPDNSGDNPEIHLDENRKLFEFKNILYQQTQLQTENKLLEFLEKNDPVTSDVEMENNDNNDSCSSECDSIIQNIFIAKKQLCPGKKPKSVKVCQECANADELNKKSECTYEHNVKRKQLNIENMCYEHQKSIPLKKWTAMGLCEKFPYYYITHNRRKLSKNGFDNFFNYLESLANKNQRINPQKTYKIWKKMSYEQKLPFIFEAFIYIMSEYSEEIKETDIKEFFLTQRKKR